MLQCPKCGRRFSRGEAVCPEDGAALRADVTVAGLAPADPLAGRVLDDKYRLDERLGEGGMGTVYRATHLLIDRPVAVKVLHPRYVEDESARERFRREARAAGRLRHPNAVAVTDFGQAPDGYVYIVMELLEGRPLREVVATEAPLAPERAIDLMSQAAAAVDAAHDAGVIHRDLKPGNIFVVQRKGLPPVVKVLDFGIAKLAADNLEDSDARNLTQTGVMIGTPRYMSPEQCDGEHLTPASDVYSLGIILYEMLTGETPFNGPTPLAVALQHSAKTPRPPRELVASIPEELERIVLHALAKRPEGRPRSAGEFREDLQQAARRLGWTQPLGAPDTVALPAVEPNGAVGGGGETPSGRLVIDLERMRERRGERGAGDTTLLADTSEQRHATGAVVAAPPTAEEPRPRRRRAFTRFNVVLPGRSGRLGGARRTAAVAAVALAALTLVLGTVAFVKARRADGPAASAGPSAAVSPTPEPSPSPTPEPSPEAAGAQNANRARRANARQQQQQQRRPRKGNRVVKTLKKIFKNPF